MKKLLLIALASTLASASVQFTEIAGIPVELHPKCVKGYKWTAVLSQGRLVSMTQNLVKDHYKETAKPVYCTGHSWKHYDSNGYPNQEYVGYNQSHGLAVTSAILGAGAYALLSSNRGANKTIIKEKTIIIKEKTPRSKYNKTNANNGVPSAYQKKKIERDNKSKLDAAKKKRLANLKAKYKNKKK